MINLTFQPLLRELRLCETEEQACALFDAYMRAHGPIGLDLELDIASIESLYQQANEQMKCQNYQEAEKYLQWLVNLQPYSPANWKLLGSAYLSQEKYAEALQVFALACQLQPTDATTYFLAAHCHVKLNEYQDAIISLRRALTHCTCEENELRSKALTFLNILNRDGTI